MMKLLDICKDDINRITPEENKLKNDVFGLVHTAKDKLFSRVIDNLKFSIENELRPMFRPICQEIYNWIKEHQSGDLMNWMNEFDPQKTKYYFHNDTQYENIVRGPSEIPEDYLIDEDDEDDELA